MWAVGTDWTLVSSVVAAVAAVVGLGVGGYQIWKARHSLRVSAAQEDSDGSVRILVENDGGMVTQVFEFGLRHDGKDEWLVGADYADPTDGTTINPNHKASFRLKPALLANFISSKGEVRVLMRAGRRVFKSDPIRLHKPGAPPASS